MKNLLSHMSLRVKTGYKLFVSWIKPGAEAIHGASQGVLIVFILLVLVSAFMEIADNGIAVALLQLLYMAGMPLMVALLVDWVVSLFVAVPKKFRMALVAALFFFIEFFGGTAKGEVALGVWFIASASLFFGAACIFYRKTWTPLVPVKKVLTVVSLVTGLTGLFLGSYWLFSQGKKIDPPLNAALQVNEVPPLINLPNPGEKGSYSVRTLTYGSGNDRHREEYKGAALITPSVDGSPFIDNWKSFHGYVRTKYWGFDRKSLPLNARVWYPDAHGPFPLVMVVHGNHFDRDYSDPGYEYLGDLLASRGFIVASVDENFLNGSWTNAFGQLKEENDARGWLLLKHLECWQKWNSTDDNPFSGKVNMDQVFLVGHSRGGEAVSIAACFNQLTCYPDDALVKFSFGFNIRGVIAIAPVDGQYKPADVGTFYKNVNYFVIQGTHDMDMRSYHGARQMQRIQFSDSLFHFKAGLYVYAANHGQFNTSWGRDDMGAPGILLFNRKNIMPAPDQEKIAAVFISAFLEIVANDQRGYLPLFRDTRSGRNWLPPTIYLNQYMDSQTTVLCSYEEDIDLTSPTVKQGTISTENLTIWREQLVPLKWGPHDTRALVIGWNREAADSAVASYALNLGRLPCPRSAALVLSLADAGEDSNPVRDWLMKDTSEVVSATDTAGTSPGEKSGHPTKTAGKKDKVKKEDQKKKEEEPYDFTIVLTDNNGMEARLALSRLAPLQRQINPRVMKMDFMSDVPKTEIVFRKYSFPLSLFMEQNPLFDPDTLRSIMLVFDRSSKGVIVTDDIGIESGYK